jgi:hypothetical protein
VRQVDEAYNTRLSVNLNRLIAQEQLLIAQLKLTDAKFTKNQFF